MLKYILKLLDWCKVAMSLQQKKAAVLFKEAEIWWCHVGLNVGIEIFGKGDQFARPVLVFKKLNTKSFLGIPLTSQLKSGSWYVPLRCDGKEARAILSQIKILDKGRLMKRIETISESEFIRIKTAFLDFYGSSDESKNLSPTSEEAGDGG